MCEEYTVTYCQSYNAYHTYIDVVCHATCRFDIETDVSLLPGVVLGVWYHKNASIYNIIAVITY